MENLTPLNAAYAVDPYAYYAQLVAERPFYFDDGIGMWVASSAAAADAVLHHPALHARPAGQQVPQAMAAMTLGGIFSQLARMTEGRAHDASRREIVNWMARYAGDAYERASEAAAELALGVYDEHDINAYVFNAPAAAMTRLIGIADSAKTRKWAGDFACALRPSADATAIARGNAGAEHLLALLSVPQSSLSANLLGLLFQSYDAGAALIACAVAGGTPDETPVHNTRRFAAETTALLGRTIERGDSVLVLLAAAHRDPAANRSYAFGAGTHACPGSDIARAIARAALDALRAAGVATSGFRVSGYHRLSNVRMPLFGATI